MSFWSNSVSEPRRNFKFLLRVQNIPVWVVKNVNLPKITLQEGKHQFLNHTFYFPGTVEYNTVSFTIVDAIEENISSKVLEAFAGGGYKIPDAVDPALTSLVTKGDSITTLGTVSIEHLGSGDSGFEGDRQISFELANAWVKDVEFATALSYDNNDPSEIKVELRYDFFKFEATGGRSLPGFGA